MIAPDYVLDTEARLPVYDAHWFLAFFASVPDDQWTTHRYVDPQGRCCAMGHLGVTNDAGTKLGNILRWLLPNIPGINDGYYHSELPHPKQRVIAALRALIPTTP